MEPKSRHPQTQAPVAGIEADASSTDSADARPQIARTPYRLFIAACIVTFGNITALSFLKPPAFFVVLVLMHVGIALFIISRKMCKRAGVEEATKPLYMREYALLIPYLAFMAYSILSRFGIVPEGGDAKTALILVWTAICAAYSVGNAIRLKAAIDKA